MENLQILLNVVWTMVGTFLIYFMQAGFAMVETGFTRAKNAGNILMKNMMDFVIGSICFFLVGFALMYGGSGAWIGTSGFFAPMGLADGDGMFHDLPIGVFLIFQTVFCGTSATIVSGAMAERTKFIAYLIYSAVVSALIYPISGHWIWGGGWLAQIGFHDFSGSTAVHTVGGMCALMGAAMVGPRLHKYTKEGKPVAIPGHNLPLGTLGVFILWFCWFGFNGCSTVSMTGDEAINSASSIFVTTNMSAAVACVVTMLFTWFRYKKPDVSMTFNAALGGLVAITAGCDRVSIAGAAIIGACAGLVLPLAVEFFDKVAKIDDPVGAISVHGVCGAMGTLLTGLLDVDNGLFYGGGFQMFGVQLLGVVSVIAWVLITMTIIFQVIKHTIGLRASAQEELDGLDLHEHGLPTAYAGFAQAAGGDGSGEIPAPAVKKTVPVDQAVPVQVLSEKAPASDVKLTKVSILCAQSRFEALKAAMNEIGITGMTVTQVLGCGVQKGKTEYYRGVEMSINLLPKIRVEIVVAKVPVRTVVEAAKQCLYTGSIGDGKIFIYDVENVIKVRTGEEGFDALQGED